MPGLFIERHARVASLFADVAVLAVIPTKDLSAIEIERKDHLLTLHYYIKSGQTASPIINKLINQFRWTIAILNGYRIIRKEMNGFDLFHVNVLTRLGLFALVIRYLEVTPYVITEHWTRYINGGFKGRLRIAATRLVVRKARGMSTVTAHLWRSMQSFGMSNPNHMVLQNVVDDLYFENNDGLTKPPANRFIHISCFTDLSKNISGLLRVLARMNENGVDFECILVGEGEDLEKLKEYASALGLVSPKVQFRGLVTGEALVQLMHEVSFLVLFSNYENMPVVINEAFAVGIPVISTDTGGISEQVKEWNGRLVKPNDEEALYSSILSLMAQGDRYDQKKIKDYAELWFSSKSVENQLKTLYGL